MCAHGRARITASADNEKDTLGKMVIISGDKMSNKMQSFLCVRARAVRMVATKLSNLSAGYMRSKTKTKQRRLLSCPAQGTGLPSSGCR